jgi:hypothetical protein
MTARLLGVSIYPDLLPPGKDDRTGTVPLSHALVRQSALNDDVVLLSPQWDTGGWAGNTGRYNHQRVYPYTSVSEQDVPRERYNLSSADLFGYYSGASNTYLSVAAQYEFYAAMPGVQYQPSLNLYA